MPSSDGGGCSGGSPLTSLINTVTGFSPPTQIKTTTQVASLQEGFRTPRAGAQDEDIVMTDFMNEQPSIPVLTATNPPQVSAEAMEKFMNWRYPASFSTDETEFEPASARTWYKDVMVWPKQGSLPQQEVEAIMDEAIVDNTAWSVPLWNCKVMLHPVSQDIAVELPNSKNVLLNHSYEFQDKAYGAVASKLEPSRIGPASLFNPPGRLIYNSLEIASNQPLQSWAQSQRWEIIRDFGDSDITIILESTAYRADKPHSSSSDHEYIDFEDFDYSCTYYDPRSDPAGTEPGQQKLFAVFTRQIDTIFINDTDGSSIGDGDAEVIMAELVSFMHTGEVTKITMSYTDNLKIGDRESPTYSHVEYYLKFFRAAVMYGVKDLPAAIVSIMKNEINWAPGIADIHSDIPNYVYKPPLTHVMEDVYDIQSDCGGEVVQSLKKFVLQKWAREVSNITGQYRTDVKYEEGKEWSIPEGGMYCGSSDDESLSHLEILSERYRGKIPGQGFHEDLREALETVKRDDGEVVATHEGTSDNNQPLPIYSLRQLSSGMVQRPRLSKL